MIDYSRKFLSAINNEDRLDELYSDWLDSLFSSPLWNKSDLDGKRIPWMKAEEAFAEMDIFNSSGLYIFGTKENVPIYLGISKGKIEPRPLKERLRSRYFGPKKETENKKYAQFQIAKNNELNLIQKGYEQALSRDIFEWYKKRYPNSKVRLIHAEKLAKLGINGIWFAGLPFRREDIRKFEKKIIPIANNWNINNNYDKLLNTQDKY